MEDVFPQRLSNYPVMEGRWTLPQTLIRLLTEEVNASVSNGARTPYTRRQMTIDPPGSCAGHDREVVTSSL